MRFLLPVIVSLLVSSAHAADLTGVLSDYLLRKVPPTASLTGDSKSKDIFTAMMAGTQMLVWDKPARLDADALLFIYNYKFGTDYWSLLIKNPHAPTSDYLGSNQLLLLGKIPGEQLGNIYRIESGRFRGFLAEDLTDKGRRVLALMTPQMATKSPTLSKYLK